MASKKVMKKKDFIKKKPRTKHNSKSAIKKPVKKKSSTVENKSKNGATKRKLARRKTRKSIYTSALLSSAVEAVKAGLSVRKSATRF